MISAHYQKATTVLIKQIVLLSLYHVVQKETQSLKKFLEINVITPSLKLLSIITQILKLVLSVNLL